MNGFFSRMPLRTHTPAAMPLPASVASSSSSPTVYDNVDNQYDQVKRIFLRKIKMLFQDF